MATTATMGITNVGITEYTRVMYAQWIAVALADLVHWLVGESYGVERSPAQDQRLWLAVDHVLGCTRRGEVVDAARVLRSFGWPDGPIEQGLHFGQFYHQGWHRGDDVYETDVHLLVDAVVHAAEFYRVPPYVYWTNSDVPVIWDLGSYVYRWLSFSVGQRRVFHKETWRALGSSDTDVMCDVAEVFTATVHPCGFLAGCGCRVSLHTQGLAQAVIAGDAQAVPILCDAIEDDGGDASHFREFDIRYDKAANHVLDALRMTHGRLVLPLGTRGWLAYGHPAGCRRLYQIAYGD